MTWRNSIVGVAPSMIAASSSSRGIAVMNVRKISTENGMQERDLDEDQPDSVLNSPIHWST